MEPLSIDKHNDLPSPFACPYWDALMDLFIGSEHYVLFRCAQQQEAIHLESLSDINQAKRCKLGFDFESSVYQPMISVARVLDDGGLELCYEMYFRAGPSVRSDEAWRKATNFAYNLMDSSKVKEEEEVE